MSDVLLTLNAGSSNLKFSIWTLPELALEDQGKIEFDRFSGIDLEKSLVRLIDHIQDNHGHRCIKIIGHRLVHGGREFYQPIVLNKKNRETIQQLIPLAPLHLPAELDAITFIESHYPGIPQVACFDTAFHKTQNALYQQFAIPKQYTDQGIIRYGFHGLSYEYIASVVLQYIEEKHQSKLIVAHLGNGASMCAMTDLHSVTTTMGFTALDGLMMGTRCGELDAGVVLYFFQHLGLNVQQIETLLYKHSGLKGVSGISADIRELESSDCSQASVAMDLFAFKAAQKLSSLIPAINGLDAIVFTGGIGEHSYRMREKIISHLTWLGAALDSGANRDNSTLIHQPESAVGVYVIPTNEELVIAKHTLGKYVLPV